MTSCGSWRAPSVRRRVASVRSARGSGVRAVHGGSTAAAGAVDQVVHGVGLVEQQRRGAGHEWYGRRVPYAAGARGGLGVRVDAPRSARRRAAPRGRRAAPGPAVRAGAGRRRGCGPGRRRPSRARRAGRDDVLGRGGVDGPADGLVVRRRPARRRPRAACRRTGRPRCRRPGSARGPRRRDRRGVPAPGRRRRGRAGRRRRSASAGRALASAVSRPGTTSTPDSDRAARPGRRPGRRPLGAGSSGAGSG